jgi:hypothetical protein
MMSMSEASIPPVALAAFEIGARESDHPNEADDISDHAREGDGLQERGRLRAKTHGQGYGVSGDIDAGDTDGQLGETR